MARVGQASQQYFHALLPARCEPPPDAIRHRALLFLGQWRKLFAGDTYDAALQVLHHTFAANELVVQSVIRAMGSKMDVEVGDTAAKDIDIDELGPGLVPQRPRHSCHDFPKGPRFFPVEIGNVRNMPLGFEIGEAGHFGAETDRHAPQRVFPDLDSLQGSIAIRPAAQQAVFACLYHSDSPAHHFMGQSSL